MKTPDGEMLRPFVTFDAFHYLKVCQRFQFNIKTVPKLQSRRFRDHAVDVSRKRFTQSEQSGQDQAGRISSHFRRCR